MTVSSNPVRLRFAPSPTGFLHIGGVRTALFNWLYARQKGGQFLLRIEDTDLERSEDRFTQDILASMKWLGLNWDEEPLYQAKRLDLYQEKVEWLISQGLAYRCTCTGAEVDEMRTQLMADGKKPMYNRKCRDLNLPHDPNTPYVIRAKIPLSGEVAFDDLIRGTITFKNEELDDFVLIRSNHAPTYNLSVVVDDVFSRMTHIARGDDHINNTPKQVHLYQFFNYTKPKFAHLPMILGADKKKLSKRHGAVSANWYRAEGFLPEALLNFLARLGWSHGDQEVFTIEELIQTFSLENVQKSSAVFNTEKLLWVNAEHIKKADPSRLQRIMLEDFSHYFVPEDSLVCARGAIAARLVALIQPKMKLMKEFAEQLVPLCTPRAVEVDVSQVKWCKSGDVEAAKSVLKSAIRAVQEGLAKKMADAAPVVREGADSAWGNSPTLESVGMGHTQIDEFLRQICTQYNVKLGDLTGPMRLAVTGRAVSAAGLFDLLPLLPFNVIEARLAKVQEY